MVLIRKDAISVDWFRWNDTANHILKSHLFGNIFANRAMHSICLPFGWALNALIGKQAGEALWPAFRLIFMHKQKGGGAVAAPNPPLFGLTQFVKFSLVWNAPSGLATRTILGLGRPVCEVSPFPACPFLFPTHSPSLSLYYGESGPGTRHSDAREKFFQLCQHNAFWAACRHQFASVYIRVIRRMFTKF